jgi:hypothetical protein
VTEYLSTSQSFPFTPYHDPHPIFGMPPRQDPPNMPVLTRDTPLAAAAAAAVAEPRPARHVDDDERALIARQFAEDNRIAVECNCGRGRCRLAGHDDDDDDDADDGEGFSRDRQASVVMTWRYKEDSPDIRDAFAAEAERMGLEPDDAPTSNLSEKAAHLGFPAGVDAEEPVDAEDGPPCFLPTWDDLATFARDADDKFKRTGGVMLACPNPDHHGKHWFIGGVPGSHDKPVTSLVVWLATHWQCKNQGAAE